MSAVYLTIPERWRKGFHAGKPERDGFRPDQWARFQTALIQFGAVPSVRALIDPARGWQIKSDADRFFMDVDGFSVAFDRVEGCPWVLETSALTTLVGCVQLITRMTLPGVQLTSVHGWESPEWQSVRALYAITFGRVLWKTPLTITNERSRS